MTRSTQTGPDLFSTSELVDVPLFDLDTTVETIVAPEAPAPVDAPDEWTDTADVYEGGQGQWLEVFDTDETPDEDTEDEDSDEDEDEESTPLEERNVILEWTVTKTYRWEGMVGELPDRVRAALHLDGDGYLEWSEDTEDDAIEALTFGDHEEDTEYVVDAAYEV